MKKLRLKAAIISFMSVVGLVSCTGSSSDLTIDQTMGQCLTYTKDINSQAQGFNRISFTSQFNYTNSTVDLAIIGVEIPVAGSTTGKQYPKMEFQGLPWTYNHDGWKVIDMTDVKPVITGMNEVPLFKNFSFMLLDVFDGGNYTPGIIYDFDIEFSVDGDKTEAKLVGCCMTGKTVSKAPDGLTYIPEEDDNIKEKNRPVYWLDYDFESSKADLYLFNAKFLGNMPSLNMVFPDIPFTVSGGVVTLEADALIPEYNGVPNNGFPISKLKGTVDFTEGMTLSFHCNFRGADYEVKFEGKY